MLRNLKNIRRLNNSEMLFVSADSDLRDEIEREFSDYFKELVVVDDGYEAVELAEINSYDVIVLDTDIDSKSFDDTCIALTRAAPTTPKVIVSENCDDDQIVTAINNNTYVFLTKPLKMQDIKLAVIMCLNQTKRGDKVEFQEGIYFDEYRDQFFKPGGKLIDFTRLEKGFMKLLISRKDEIVDYDTIKNVVWKGKNMSIYTMRNIVNKIRQKTYYEIIKNHSNKGYTLDNSRM